jgi:hypothetical protein
MEELLGLVIIRLDENGLKKGVFLVIFVKLSNESANLGNINTNI